MNIYKKITLTKRDKRLLVKADGFDDAAIGISFNNELIYSYEKMVDILLEDNELSVDEAKDYIDYNILSGGCSMKRCPIIVSEII